MIAGEVGGDAEEPGAWLVVAADLLETLPGAEKCLLGDIVAGLLVASDAPEIPQNRAFVRMKELLEGRLARLQGLRLA